MARKQRKKRKKKNYRPASPPVRRRLNSTVAQDGTGLEVISTLVLTSIPITSFAWSPDGTSLATWSDDGKVRIWDWAAGEVQRTIETSRSDRLQLFWPEATTLQLLTPYSTHGLRLTLTEFAAAPFEIRASDGSLSRGALKVDLTTTDLSAASWPTSQLAYNWTENAAVPLPLDAIFFEIVRRWPHPIFSAAASPNDKWIVAGDAIGQIVVWDRRSLRPTLVIEGHTGSVVSVRYSPDGRILASKSDDGTVRLWSTRDWNAIAAIPETRSSAPLRSARDLYVHQRRFPWADAERLFASVEFHPAQGLLATLGENDATAIRIWRLSLSKLLSASTVEKTRHTSAKIVLIGESNVGKSCLALRLAEDRYPRDNEQGTTHGMRFWRMPLERLGNSARPPAGERRDVVLWDMGGQDEYRLVHQLFLHDTTVALIAIDPTRGQAALDEAEAWNKRLSKQLNGRRAETILVGTKVDSARADGLVDRRAISRFVQENKFAGYCETSALENRGMAELLRLIAKTLDWKTLAKTTRPEFFQNVRDELERQRKNGRVLVTLSELEGAVLPAGSTEDDRAAVSTVAEQLAAQGVIADTHLASGERVLVLQIEQIERYGGSLIVAARNNPRGVPALEERSLGATTMELPGIAKNERLPLEQERVILECVVQLLITHGICFQHDGLLIFPSLFRNTEVERNEELTHATSLYYDFSGAVDNLYASLVAWLVMAKDFGVLRLWDSRAEFETSGQGLCGVRKVERGRGLAHVDVYFSEDTSRQIRDQFISFVEDHLRRQDIDVSEHLEMECRGCRNRFSDADVRERIARGEADIGCVKCDCRTELATGVLRARDRDPGLEQRTFALRTRIREALRSVANSVQQIVANSNRSSSDRPFRILHLSDLHFDPDAAVEASLRPLIADLQSSDGGLGFSQLDALVVSGDITNTADPKEFEKAKDFVSQLIRQVGLTAERCVFVPGNHDLSWDEHVYEWRNRRVFGREKFDSRRHVEQGGGLLVRLEDAYPRRFANFSKFFFHPIVQKPYPLSLEGQGDCLNFAEAKVQFVSLNSAWEIDEYFPKRSSINLTSLARVLGDADAQLDNQQLRDHLRIAVWHHPVTGNEKIEGDAFVQQLIQARVKLVFHGHVHESREDSVRSTIGKSMSVLGAGSFGAPSNKRPESTPRLYNVVEVLRPQNIVRVHTRALSKVGGAWEGWPQWPGDDVHQRRTFYELRL